MLRRTNSRPGPLRMFVLGIALLGVTTLSGCAHCHGGDWFAPVAAYVIIDALQHCWCH